jgi:2-oxoglutarate dehydrogenase E2 component (dihydrolipoamide succinyltransferase)
MKVEMVMPQMGESIAEGTVLKWLKKEGDRVEKDENILEISTDKVDSEIPAPASGTIVALLAAEGETVPVGKVIAHIETEASAAAPAQVAPVAPAAAPAVPATPAPAAPTAPAESAPAADAAAPATTEPPAAAVPPATPASAEPAAAAVPIAPAPPAPSAPAAGGDRIPPRDESGRFYSPLVRAIAQAEGITAAELAGIPGTGQGGRLTKDDLAAFVEKRKGGPAAMPQPQIPSEPTLRVGTAPSAPPAQPARGAGVSIPTMHATELRSTPEGPVDVVPMDHIRQKIAEHMVRSKATSPHVASITEVDMSRIVRWREANKESFEQREGFKLTYTPFFVEATARALREFPFVNASIDGTNVLVKRYVNIGIAVATDYGLLVPVVKGADTRNFLGLARAVNDLASRARSKALKPDEVSGGTFSITNMGTVGTLFGIPIIAQPQIAILGIGVIQKRPVVRDDAIAIRDMMYMCLSYDHRIIDGAMGGAFVERVAQHLETMELS